MDQHALNRLYLQRLKLDLLRSQVFQLAEMVSDPQAREALRQQQRTIWRRMEELDAEKERLDHTSEQIRLANLYAAQEMALILEHLIARTGPRPTPVISLRLHHDELGNASYVGRDAQDIALVKQIFISDSIHPTLIDYARGFALARGYTLVTVENTVEG